MYEQLIEEYVAKCRKFTDRELLRFYLTRAAQNPDRIILLGFTEYTKHLVNMFGPAGHVLGIVDNDPEKQDWTYKGVSVVSIDEAFACKPDHFICCSVSGWMELIGQVKSHERFDRQRITYRAPRNTLPHVQPWKDLTFYRNLRLELQQKGLQTMVPEGPRLFLVESLNLVLHLPGDVLEIGVWQGGSSLGLARLMLKRNIIKNLILVDLFEKYDEVIKNNPAGVMCLDEIKNFLSFYPETEYIEGDFGEDMQKLKDRQFCFVHYDMSCKPDWLEFIVDRIVPGGIMILDNFAWGFGSAEKFQKWFRSKGMEVSYTGHHAQGFTIKV